MPNLLAGAMMGFWVTLGGASQALLIHEGGIILLGQGRTEPCSPMEQLHQSGIILLGLRR